MDARLSGILAQTWVGELVIYQARRGMRPRTIKQDGWEEIERVAVERAKLPTDVELAQKNGVSRRRIQQIMKRARDAFVRVCVGDNPDSARNNPTACNPSSEESDTHG